MTPLYRRPRLAGFTIVELAVVIVIITILATIVIMTYGNYQAQMRDATRKNDAQQIAAALKSYAAWNNNYLETGSGCGISGNGNGWVAAQGGTLYATSIVKCLQDAKMLDTGTFIDPSGCVSDSGGACGSWRGLPAQAYMKVTCTKGDVKTTYVLAHLETEPRKDAEINNLCAGGTVPGFTGTIQWGTDYGMNYYVRVG